MWSVPGFHSIIFIKICSVWHIWITFPCMWWTSCPQPAGGANADPVKSLHTHMQVFSLSLPHYVGVYKLLLTLLHLTETNRRFVGRLIMFCSFWQFSGIVLVKPHDRTSDWEHMLQNWSQQRCNTGVRKDFILSVKCFLHVAWMKKKNCSVKPISAFYLF